MIIFATMLNLFSYNNLQLISCVAANQECVKDIAASQVLAYLLLAIQALPNCRVLTLESLAALMSSTQIVKEAMAKGKCCKYISFFEMKKLQIHRDTMLLHFEFGSNYWVVCWRVENNIGKGYH